MYSEEKQQHMILKTSASIKKIKSTVFKILGIQIIKTSFEIFLNDFPFQIIEIL